MTTIAEKLTTIDTALGNIKTAIINKGQTPSGDITTYATAINNISGGGGDEIDALNLTGATLSDGDKVWLDSQIVEQSSSGSKYMDTYANSAYTFMTTDGNYLLSGTRCLNFSTQQITTISQIPSLYDSGNSPVYADNGLVFIDGTMVNTPSPYNPGYGRALGGNFFFTRNGANCEIRKIDLSTGTVLATHSFTLQYSYALRAAWLVMDGVVYLYIVASGDSYFNNQVAYVAKSLSTTDLTEIIDTKGVLNIMATMDGTLSASNLRVFYATSDSEFIIRFPNSAYNGFKFTLYRQNSSGIYTAIANINDVCPDMASFYNSYGYITFNPISGVVVFNNEGYSGGMGAFQYQPETKTFVKLDVSLTSADRFIYCDNEGKTLGWLDSSRNGKYIKLAKNEDGFVVIPYNTTYLRSSAFTGYITEGGASNEVVKVATTMPEKLNVSVTVNANDAEISGGIE